MFRGRSTVPSSDAGKRLSSPPRFFVSVLRFSRHTGVGVAVLYLAVPDSGTDGGRGDGDGWSGGELVTHRSQADAWRGAAPVCSFAPVVGTVARFRGDLCHEVRRLECNVSGAAGAAGAAPRPLGGERVSVVLEQYDTSRSPSLLSEPAARAGWRTADETWDIRLPLPPAHTAEDDDGELLGTCEEK